MNHANNRDARANSSPGPSTLKALAVQTATGNLSHEIEELESRLSVLHDRLHPVLRSEAVCGGVGQERTVSATPLCDQIDTLADRVHAATNRINNILDLLEV